MQRKIAGIEKFRLFLCKYLKYKIMQQRQQVHSTILFIALFTIIVTLIWNVSDAIWSNSYIETLPDFALVDNLGMQNYLLSNNTEQVNINDILQTQQWSQTFICCWLIALCTFMTLTRYMFAKQQVKIDAWKFYSGMVVVLLIALTTFEMTLYMKNFAMLLVQLLSAFVATIAFAKQQ